MNSLVTGASGFIGSHLVDRLVEEGHSVTALVRKTSRLRWLENSPARLVTGDIRDAGSLIQAVKDQDLVFHVAGVVRARNAAAFHETNRGGTENLLDVVMEHNPQLKKFVYVSSMAAGGPTTPDHPMTEEDPSLPITNYGRSKYGGEQSVLSVSDKLDVVAVRPPVVYGPRDKGVFTFISLVSKGIEVNLGARDRYVTVVHISDLTDLLLLTATSEIKSGELFYQDDGTPVRTWFELQDVMAKTMDRKSVKIRIPLGIAFPIAVTMDLKQRITGRKSLITFDKYREISQRAWLCDGTKAREELGFTPRYGLEDGFRETIEWCRQVGWIEQ